MIPLPWLLHLTVDLELVASFALGLPALPQAPGSAIKIPNKYCSLATKQSLKSRLLEYLFALLTTLYTYFYQECHEIHMLLLAPTHYLIQHMSNFQ